MEVVVETSEGRSFTIEIWFFSTILEIKEKIHTHHGVPIESQTVYFKGKPLDDDAKDTEFYGLHHGSRLHLALDQQPPMPPPPSIPHLINVKSAVTKRHFTLEVDLASDNVCRLVERLQEAEGVHASRFAVLAGGVELVQGQRLIRECGVEGQEVVVVPRMRKTAKVVLVAGKGRVVVEVNLSDKVRELRRELERMELSCVPSQDFFFIHKQGVMDEERTFRCHDVRPGDTIEMFPGTVT